MKHIPILDIGSFKNSERNLEFYSNTFNNHLKYNHTKISKPHKHDFYLIVLFTSGQGFHEIDFKRYTVEPKSLFILRPGQVHNWKFSEDIEGYICFHNKGFYEGIYANSQLSDFSFFNTLYSESKISLNDSQFNDFKFYFQKILDEYMNSANSNRYKLVSLLNLMYCNIEELNHIEFKNIIHKSSVYANQMLLFEKLIEINFRINKLPKFYAEKLNITAKHLNRIAKNLLNKTATEIIYERVILEAKRELLNSKNSLSDVAWSLGFEDYAYFSRIFKKSCGITPSQFQRKYLNYKNVK